jgi:hypothetical protein
MLEEAGKLFVVEYSILQDATHLRSLRAMLQNNVRNLGEGTASDYVPIALFESRADAEQFIMGFLSHLSSMPKEPVATRNWRSIAEIVESLTTLSLSSRDSEPRQITTTSADAAEETKSESKSDR